MEGEALSAEGTQLMWDAETNPGLGIQVTWHSWERRNPPLGMYLLWVDIVPGPNHDLRTRVSSTNDFLPHFCSPEIKDPAGEPKESSTS